MAHQLDALGPDDLVEGAADVPEDLRPLAFAHIPVGQADHCLPEVFAELIAIVALLPGPDVADDALHLIGRKCEQQPLDLPDHPFGVFEAVRGGRLDVDADLDRVALVKEDESHLRRQHASADGRQDDQRQGGVAMTDRGSHQVAV